jgi:drug/metabolite transporter (DMT)-like permease
MAFGKCDNCEQQVKVKQTKQKYILPLFLFFAGLLILAYERDLGNPHSVVTVLGGLAAVAGFVWLVLKGVRYISK